MASDPRLRSELDALPKEELVRRAEAQGIDGARKLTRLELIDELMRLEGAPRGLLGKARDMLRGALEVGIARVLESARPPPPAAEEPMNDAPASDAAVTLRRPVAVEVTEVVAESEPVTLRKEPAVTPSSEVEPARVEPSEGAPIATVTLARVFLAQGHAARAAEILDQILRQEPDHRAALELRALLAERAKAASVRPPPPPPPPIDEPEVDECVALVVDDATVHVAWDAGAATLARARRAFRDAEPTLVLRVLTVVPDLGGPILATHDQPIEPSGDHFVRDLAPHTVVRAAIGLLAGDRFVPVAHTADVESMPNDPDSRAATFSDDDRPEVVVWSESGTTPATKAQARTFRERQAIGPRAAGDPSRTVPAARRPGFPVGNEATSPIRPPPGRPTSPGPVFPLAESRRASTV